MADNLPRSDRPRWQTLEFFLVVIMLAVMLTLVFAVLLMSFPPTPMSEAPKLPDNANIAPADVQTYRNSILEYSRGVLAYRKDILSIIITAFGAWVGAGAAYFFGRENLRTAADSLLAMRDQSPAERLRRTPVRRVPPFALEWVEKLSNPLKPVFDKLEADPQLWFITIVKDDEDGTLETVLHEETLWRFALENDKKLDDKKVSDLVAFVNKPGNKLGPLTQIYVPIKMDMSVSAAYELMLSKSVFLAIVVNDKNKPTHYVTTAEVRKLILEP